MTSRSGQAPALELGLTAKTSGLGPAALPLPLIYNSGEMLKVPGLNF